MTEQEKLLWAAFERIKANPEEYSQNTFYERGGCGTVGCLAYHICLVADKDWLAKTIAHMTMIGVAKIELSDALGMAASVSASDFMGFTMSSSEFHSLFGVFGSYDEYFTSAEKVAWLEGHIKCWIDRFVKLKPTESFL